MQPVLRTLKPAMAGAWRLVPWATIAFLVSVGALSPSQAQEQDNGGLSSQSSGPDCDHARAQPFSEYSAGAYFPSIERACGGRSDPPFERRGDDRPGVGSRPGLRAHPPRGYRRGADLRCPGILGENARLARRTNRAAVRRSFPNSRNDFHRGGTGNCPPLCATADPARSPA